MNNLAQLPAWREVRYVRVPLCYQGYVRLAHSMHVPRPKRQAKPWSARRRNAMIKRYAADIGQPPADRTLRHIAPYHRGGWVIRFRMDGKEIYLGVFRDRRDACAAWDKWMREWMEAMS